MELNWNLIVEIALFCVVAVISVVFVPWLKEKLGAERINRLWKWICMAVQAAEQLFGPGTGKEKKQYVLEFLAGRGIDATEDVDIMIEAAVRELTD